MKKLMKSLALVLVLVMCVGMFAACSDGSGETESTKPSTTPSTATKADPEIVGLVKEVSGTFVKLELYNAQEGTDYTTLDVNTLTLTGETDYVYITSSAVYDYVSDGKLVDLKDKKLEEGNIVAVVQTVKGIQQFIVLNYSKTDDTTKPSLPTEGTTPTEGTVTE